MRRARKGQRSISSDKEGIVCVLEAKGGSPMMVLDVDGDIIHYSEEEEEEDDDA